MCDTILDYCENIIQESLSQMEEKRKVYLLREIIHFTAKINTKDSKDSRKNQKYLRDLIAALCNFHFEGSFFIPNSWEKIGKGSFQK